MQMQMVLIPTWVERAVTTAKKPLACVLDVAELTDTLSKEDIAFYIDVNERLSGKIFRAVSETFMPVMLYPFSRGQLSGNMRATDEALKGLQEYLTRKINDIRIESPEPSITKLLDHVPRFDGQETAEGQFENQYTFEAFHLRDNVIGIRPVLLKDDEQPLPQHIRAYDNLMKLMTTFIPFPQVASTPAFRAYTALLRSAQQ